MARTELFGALRRAFAAARLSERERDALRTAPGISRRTFLAGTAAAAAATAMPALAKRDPGRVAIVGGGVAGLNCVHRLAKAGVRATVYEASKRTGGRIWTAQALSGPETWTELGAEFIDTNHKELRRLVREFDLDLIDFATRKEGAFEETYYFGGRYITHDDIVEAFRSVAPRIAADFDRAGDPSYAGANPDAVALDQTPLSEYLRQAGADDFLYSLLDVAYLTEYGLDCDEQSALNLIFLIGTTPGSFDVYGESDERFKVRGGNQRIVDALAERYGNQILREHKLEAIAPNGAGFRMTFTGPNGQSIETVADSLVLALPFTLLREVDIQVPLPPHKRAAIDTLGYGMNAKIFAATANRAWRDAGRNGVVYTDLPFALTWDHTQLQPGTAGGLTFFSGGKGGLKAGEGTPEERVAEMLPDLDRVLPGTAAAYTGAAKRMHWPTYPFAKASYTCYRPGQWTTIAGAEFEPVGNLYFAGEHCSIEFQGFMNGGAQTGRDAAELILKGA